MRIWLINHYAVPPQYYPLARQNYFAKNLMALGHEVTIFAASTVHNSDQNLIEDDTPYREDVVDGVHYVLVRCKGYHGNGLSRILNMLEFARKLPSVCNQYPRPDAIVATSHVLCGGHQAGPEIRLPGHCRDRGPLAGECYCL